MRSRRMFGKCWYGCIEVWYTTMLRNICYVLATMDGHGPKEVGNPLLHKT